MVLFDDLGNEVHEVHINEKLVQRIFERSLYNYLGVHFLVSEYEITTKSGRRRLDTLGIDIHGSPVVIEYKKNNSRTLVNQGLLYMDLLRGCKTEFEHLALKKNMLNVNWNNPRLICLAKKYHDYDFAIAKNSHCSIELIQYQIYDNGQVILNHLNQSPTELVTNDISATEDALTEFLRALSVHGIKYGSNKRINQWFGKGLSVMPYQPPSGKDDPGLYGRANKQQACIYGREMILMKVEKMCEVLSTHGVVINKNLVQQCIDNEFKSSMVSSTVDDALVLAPKQYITRYGAYTAFNKQALFNLVPEFAEINWE